MFFRDNEDRFCRIRRTGRLDRKPSHGSTAAKLAAIDLGLQQSAAPRLFESKELIRGKQNIGALGLGRCTVPGQLVGKNTFQASQPPQLLMTLASASSR